MRRASPTPERPLLGAAIWWNGGTRHLRQPGRKRSATATGGRYATYETSDGKIILVADEKVLGGVCTVLGPDDGRRAAPGAAARWTTAWTIRGSARDREPRPQKPRAHWEQERPREDPAPRAPLEEAPPANRCRRSARCARSASMARKRRSPRSRAVRARQSRRPPRDADAHAGLGEHTQEIPLNRRDDGNRASVTEVRAAALCRGTRCATRTCRRGGGRRQAPDA